MLTMELQLIKDLSKINHRRNYVQKFPTSLSTQFGLLYSCLQLCFLIGTVLLSLTLPIGVSSQLEQQQRLDCISVGNTACCPNNFTEGPLPLNKTITLRNILKQESFSFKLLFHSRPAGASERKLTVKKTTMENFLNGLESHIQSEKPDLKHFLYPIGEIRTYVQAMQDPNDEPRLTPDDWMELLAFDDVDQFSLMCNATTHNITLYFYPFRSYVYEDFIDQGNYGIYSLKQKRDCSDWENSTTLEKAINKWYKDHPQRENSNLQELLYSVNPKNCNFTKPAVNK